jgi:ssRNA-specific RNase YbeY (16S rRNA maturation enzyme)
MRKKRTGKGSIKNHVSVIVLDKRYRTFEKSLQSSALKLLSLLKRKESFFEVYVVNSSMMNKNVLAFPHEPSFPKPDIGGVFLGEVYLNPTYIKKAKEDLEYMLIHGLLHLLDYDHVKRSDRIAMERKEIYLKSKLTEQSL